MGQVGIVICPRCRGGRYVYDRATRKWAACRCTAIGEGTAKPATTFGSDFGRFILRVSRSKGPSLVLGTFPALREAAECILVTAGKIEVRGRLWTVEDLVDAWFDRERKAAFVERASTAPLAVVLCGEEAEHKWNGTCLAAIVGRRRVAGLPTILCAVGDPASLYGERGEECFRGLASYPKFRIKEEETEA